MLILVLNSGSSSVKYQLINAETEELVTKGQIEKIGHKDAIFSYLRGDGEPLKEVHPIYSHEEAIALVLKSLTSSENMLLTSVDEILAIGHRVVHGGENFTESVIITEDVMAEIRDCVELAPLHNPANLQGINVCLKQMPNIPQVAVFDTAFHQSMPEKAYIYGIPFVMYTRHKIRRYGFHGTSHRYITSKLATIMQKPLKNINAITCHLGNGASIAAIKNGKSIDTSMGFTPLEGLIMGTRCGDIDPAIVTHIMAKEGLTGNEVNTLLNKHSGLLGISGSTNDVRELFELVAKKDPRAELALDIMVYRLKKYISSYMAVLGGADAIVFTAGVGENNAILREKALEGLEFMGIKLDKRKNKNASGDAEISADSSTVKVYVLPTNEELVIARDTVDIMKKLKRKDK